MASSDFPWAQPTAEAAPDFNGGWLTAPDPAPIDGLLDVVPIPKLSSSLSAIEVVEIPAQLKLPFHAAGYDNVTSTYVEDVTNNAIRIGQVCSDLVRLSFEQYGTSNAVWADDNAKIMLKVFADGLAEAGPEASCYDVTELSSVRQ